MTLDWRHLYFGHVHSKEVLEVVKDEEWQALRLSLKGKSLEFKYNALKQYLTKHPTHAARVRVTNYVTALSRGGLIKPEDYK